MENKINGWQKEYYDLLSAALKTRERAYTPYSKFKVGAAILTRDNKIISGCNIENASYPVGICAERVAISSAISEGYNEFKALLIVGGKDGKNITKYCFPCGMCRQFLREFCSDDFKLIFVKYNIKSKTPEFKIYTLSELLPESFEAKNLK